MPNRLAAATSPYLRQHAENPVEWWPWTPEAFASARERDLPVLISIGYAACHWCHVMAHESFEDPSIAALLNLVAVPIKVDREERPDVDSIYLTATQLATGQAGWPMTILATPDGQPFFCGTYLRPRDFTRLLSAVDEAWRNRREELTAHAAAVAETLSGEGALTSVDSTRMTAEVLDAAAGTLAAEYDRRDGGFGGAPKFPPHLNLLFLLRHHQRTGDPRALEITRATCAAMARGGLYDLLGGGFARYAVDRTWTVPHFEKMLYDNALLLRVYTNLWRLTGDQDAARVAAATAAFLRDELRTSEGGFASSLDADTAGEEGATYVWTRHQLRDVLGGDDGDWAADLLGVTSQGTFERGTSVLRLIREPEDPVRFERVREILLASRRTRPQPDRDDKVIAAWNGLAITALVEYALTSAALGESGPAAGGLAAGADWAGQLAIDAGHLLARVHLVDGRLRRVSRAGVAAPPAGVLDDYGLVAEAWCALHQYTGDGHWLELAAGLLDVGLTRFGAPTGGFYDTSDDAERLIARPTNPTDNPTPAGTAAIAAALVTCSALGGDPGRFREAAERALGILAPLAAEHARFVGYACLAGEALLAGPSAIAVATSLGTADPLFSAAWRRLPPGAVVVAGQPDTPGVPLLANRPMRAGRATAYLCRGTVCDAPITTVADLAAALKVAAGRGQANAT
jgi:uncharacterized protein YyaL (SSP411 family)